MSAKSNTGQKLYVRTPLIESTALSEHVGCQVYLKLENTQPTASFKIRGISNLMQNAMARGCTRMVASSGGNAGLAAAYSARKLGVPITIYIPESTPAFTKHRLEAEGATVIIHGSVWDKAEAKALEDAQDPGCTYIPPFEHPEIWAGHASLVEELAADLQEPPDLLVVSVGGGGLLCGVVQGMDRVGWGQVPVLCMETIGADCYNKSVAAGEVITIPDITSVAKCLGSLTPSQTAFDFHKSHHLISEVIEDKVCIDACLKFLDDHRMLIEPACGAALAAVYGGIIGRLKSENKLKSLRSVVIIVCGGSVVRLEELLAWKQQFGL